jgi:hypothetical protein
VWPEENSPPRVFVEALSMALNLFYPIVLLYLLFALRRVYRQSWPQSVWKVLILFVCETLLFIIVNIAGFVIAFALV